MFRKTANRPDSSFFSAPHHRKNHHDNSLDLDLERLEDRQLLTGVVVTNNLDVVDGDTSSIAALVANQGDDDGISLREAIVAANNTSGADQVTFANGLSGQTILLGGTELEISEALSIDASALNGNVAIDAQGGSRVINFSAEAGNLDLVSLTITGGQSTRGGGGIYSVNGDVSLSNSALRDNVATGSGGGIQSIYGDVVLMNSTVSGNRSGRAGGAMYTIFGDSELTNTTVSGNTSSTVGGGLSSVHGAVTLAGSTIAGNRSGSDGGGLHLVRGDLTVANATVSGNRSDAAGGGVHLISANAVVENSTITNNISLEEGGGIASDNSNDLTLTNSIVAGNAAGGDGDDMSLDLQGSLAANYSLFGEVEGPVTDGAGNLTGDPMLAPLADIGGLTMTHALLSNSPAFNAGDPNAAVGQNGIPEFDQRGEGFGRSQFGRMDMGAVEATSGLFVTGSTLNIGGVDGMNDRVAITENAESLRVRLNGTNSALIASQDVTNIEVMTYGGHDNVKILLRNERNVVVDAGAGNDVVRVRNAGNSELRGDDGKDRLFGGGGTNMILGGNGVDRLVGRNSDDLLRGDDGNDVIIGAGGNDILLGDSGNDRLVAGAGRDLLIGGRDSDHLVGGSGDDILIGGTTDYNDHDTNLQLIMSIWTQDVPKNVIMAEIDSTVPLRWFDQVHNDGVRDTLIGGAQQDWVFVGDEDRRIGPNSDIVSLSEGRGGS